MSSLNTDNNGDKKSKTGIIADYIQFLAKPKGAEKSATPPASDEHEKTRQDALNKMNDEGETLGAGLGEEDEPILF